VSCRSSPSGIQKRHILPASCLRSSALASSSAIASLAAAPFFIQLTLVFAALELEDVDFLGASLLCSSEPDAAADTAFFANFRAMGLSFGFQVVPSDLVGSDIHSTRIAYPSKRILQLISRFPATA